MSQVTGMFMMLALMQAVKYFDLANAKYTVVVRTAYAGAQMVIFAALYYMFVLIRQSANHSPIRIPRVANPFTDTGNEPEEETVSAQEYDLRELKKFATSQLFSFLLLMTIHFWLKTLQPLIFQSIMPLKSLWSHPLFKIYVRGHVAEGKLKRPFKEQSPLADLFNRPQEEATAADDIPIEDRIVELSDEVEEEGAKATEQERTRTNKRASAETAKATTVVVEEIKKTVIEARDEEEPLLKQRRKPTRKADD